MGADSNKADEIHQRLINFGTRTTRVAKMLPRTDEGRYISRQLLRSGLAVAPNYAEARGAESRADFIHKLRIVLKELNESKSWLEPNRRQRSLFSRQNGWNYRGKPRTCMDHCSLHQDRARWFRQSDLKISDLRCRIRPISNFFFYRHRSISSIFE